MSRHKPAKRTPKPASDPDRALREWVFELLANPEIAGGIAIKNMQMQFDWVKSGTVPGGAEVIRVERKSA